MAGELSGTGMAAQCAHAPPCRVGRYPMLPPMRARPLQGGLKPNAIPPRRKLRPCPTTDRLAARAFLLPVACRGRRSLPLYWG